MSSDDGVAGDVAPLHPLAGARDQPVGGARVGREEGDAGARGDAARAEQRDDAGAEVVHPLGVVLEQDQLVLVGAVRRQHVARAAPAARPSRRPSRPTSRARRAAAAPRTPARTSTPCRTPPRAAPRSRRASAAGARAPSAGAAGSSASPTRSRSPRRAAPARAAPAAAGCRAGACRWCCPCPRSPAPRPTCSRAWCREAFGSSMRTSSFSSRPIDTPPDSGSGCIEKMFAPITIRWRTPSSTGRSSTSRTVGAPDAVASGDEPVGHRRLSVA